MPDINTCPRRVSHPADIGEPASFALWIPSYLSLGADTALRHRASKIARSKSSATDVEDEKLCKVIVDKFEKLGKGTVSYADIAGRAWEVDKAGLATKVSTICLALPAVGLVDVNLPTASRPRDACLGSGTAPVDDERSQINVVEGGGQ